MQEEIDYEAVIDYDEIPIGSEFHNGSLFMMTLVKVSEREYVIKGQERRWKFYRHPFVETVVYFVIKNKNKQQ